MKRMPEDEQRRLRESPPPDPLTQLLHMFKRIATSREWYIYMYTGQLGTKLILYSGKVLRALNLAIWILSAIVMHAKIYIGEFLFGDLC